MRKKQPERTKGLYVNVYDNNIEKALSIFKQKVKDSNLLMDYREKSFYQKPSEVRRHKKNLAKLRQKYRIERENTMHSNKR